MKMLVTGGGGFLGGRIVRMLRDGGHEVVALGRNAYPELAAIGVRCIQVDVRNADAVTQACRGIDVVFHTAALAAIWGPRRVFHEINVAGTRNVIDACRHQGVGRLVFTSSPSVVFGEDDLCGVDESQPYPPRYLAHYPETKAAAEKLVLDADGSDLSTIALRPHLIWGPGDPHLIPRVIDQARRGRLRRVGDGTNLVDITYIDNAAAAHVRAAEALSVGAACAGRAYFISQGEPVALWPWLGEVLRRAGAPAVTKSISYATARRLGAALETLHRLVRSRREPRMTRFMASQLAKSHYFNISAARRDFGYEATVSADDGLDRLFSSASGGEASASSC